MKKSVANTPADPTLPKVPLVIDGMTYFLVWDFNALAFAESLTGVNLLVSLDFDHPTAKQLQGMLFAGLLKCQPKTTLQTAGSMITCRNIAQVMDALILAYHGSMPEPKLEAESPNVETPEKVN